MTPAHLQAVPALEDSALAVPARAVLVPGGLALAVPARAVLAPGVSVLAVPVQLVPGGLVRAVLALAVPAPEVSVLALRAPGDPTLAVLVPGDLVLAVRVQLVLVPGGLALAVLAPEVSVLAVLVPGDSTLAVLVPGDLVLAVLAPAVLVGDVVPVGGLMMAVPNRESVASAERVLDVGQAALRQAAALAAARQADHAVLASMAHRPGGHAEFKQLGLGLPGRVRCVGAALVQVPVTATISAVAGMTALVMDVGLAQGEAVLKARAAEPRELAGATA